MSVKRKHSVKNLTSESFTTVAEDNDLNTYFFVFNMINSLQLSRHKDYHFYQKVKLTSGRSVYDVHESKINFDGNRKCKIRYGVLMYR